MIAEPGVVNNVGGIFLSYQQNRAADSESLIDLCGNRILILFLSGIKLSFARERIENTLLCSTTPQNLTFERPSSEALFQSSFSAPIPKQRNCTFLCFVSDATSSSAQTLSNPMFPIWT